MQVIVLEIGGFTVSIDLRLKRASGGDAKYSAN